MKVRNITKDGLIIGDTGQLVEAGAVAEVPDALGASLCEQVDVWAAVAPSVGGRSKQAPSGPLPDADD